MEELVKELKSIIKFKDTIEPGDVVIIAAKKPQMLLYAYVTDIERDPSRKDEWWHVGLTVLSIPPQKMTWTLRTAQMTGLEIFTMGGEERFVKALEFRDDTLEPKESSIKKKGAIKRIK